ncbi:hypothetical protein [Teredinibacter haidensis]|uniref:hypothetical protein n=1 Tax=Teredinibacter haidensis TaxID=2731755 RepID=UPI0009489821|nr:hypothetical protein [Teredinibacter haidensis]
MPHCISDIDKSFLSAFENSTLEVTAFHHREHVRLAYIELVLNDVNGALQKIRNGLLRLLEQNGIDKSQYHETLTFAWVRAIRHFMSLTENTKSSEDFVRQNKWLLDKEVMFNHYSRALISQEKSRSEYVPPDLQPIPEHC